ncbi:hypothetical protein [Fimbriiglobus ruber]|uniref:Uncharacterized protein n=1 Tax=Fimbriiglobus ruber TaxID=1908690 RepID=A0A225DPT6_9BACT|nr:hypothetical protein [Fimbriiglobus ruber]OWK39516.1 hypothetical protein FRUB_06079 [Fimbriiglobus ruber]
MTTQQTKQEYTYRRSTDGCDETFDVRRPDGELLTSVHFWDDLEYAEEKAKLIVHRMNCHERLVEALNYLLEQTVDQDLKHGITLSEGEEDARTKALAVIAEAAGSRILPPDPEGMNDKRSAWAGAAIAAFQETTGTDDEDALSDLLGDLRHWADRNNYDFEAASLRARCNYEAETGGVAKVTE